MLSERFGLGLVLAFGSRRINQRDHGGNWWVKDALELSRSRDTHTSFEQD